MVAVNLYKHASADYDVDLRGGLEMIRSRVGMCALGLVVASTAQGANLIGGTVVDRNGDPMPKALIELTPGNVELVTDRSGAFQIDYLRDPQGERVKLEKKTVYELKILKAGYHAHTVSVPYRHGPFLVEPVVMVPITIEVDDIRENLDKAVPTTATDLSYEGG